MKKLIYILLALALTGCQKGEIMAVDFTATGQRVDFGEIAAVNDLYNQPQTWAFWLNADNLTGQDTLSVWMQNSNFVHAGIQIYTLGGAGYNRLYFLAGFTDTDGAWRTDTDTLTTGAWYHVAITYDGSNGTAEDPLMYINGVSQNVTEIQTPVGDIGDPAGEKLIIGGSEGPTGQITPDGKIEDPRVYSIILSQVEIAELYQSRLVRSISSGLVFHPVFCGAAGLIKFDGATLGTSNRITDNISGVGGIPYSNPIGRGNTIQRVY